MGFDMRVLVTGGTGFIGGHVLRELLRQGHEALAYDSMPATDTMADIASKVTIVKGDVQELTALIDTVKKFGITHVVHTASLLTADSQRRPWAALNINVTGTVNILETARIMNVAQIVYMSSTAVYGYTKEGELIDEEYEQKPVTIYGATKLFCEHYGLNYNRDYGVGFTALRFPIVYGPGQTYRGFSSFKEVVEKPVMGLPAKVPCGGDHKYDGMYVKDAASAIVSACLRNKTEHRVFNIGTGAMYSLKDLANMVRNVIPDAAFEIGPGFDVAEPVKGPLSITRAKKELGYEPKFDLQAAVADYIRTVKSSLTHNN
jgi:nucleoside-diphosphate-sugar epimerase